MTWVGTAVVSALTLNRLIGPGVIRNLLLVRYHSPREEQRALLFIDLVGSTAIAERIGATRFLVLMNQFVYDIDAALEGSGGVIYRYVGDEATINWHLVETHDLSRTVEVVFRLRALIAARGAEYRSRFGMLPDFPAALHAGPVVAGEMGDSKLEVVLLGDTVNTTARIGHGKARRGSRFNEGPAERIVHSVADRGHRTAAAAPGVFAPVVAFAAPEVRQDLGIGPAGRAFLGPALVVEGMAPDVGHGVDCGRPTEPLAARLKDAATGEMFLRHRVVAPVPRAAIEVRCQGCRHSDRPVIGPSPGLDEQHPEIGVLAQTRREDATGRSGAHDDVVELAHGRTRWQPVAGILRGMAGATGPASCRAASGATPTPPPRSRGRRPSHPRPQPYVGAESPFGGTYATGFGSPRILRRIGTGAPFPPDAPVTLWTTREVERDRFRSADGLVHRSVTMMPGNSRLTDALTEALDSSPHWGPGQLLVSVMSASLRDSIIVVSANPGAVQSGVGVSS